MLIIALSIFKILNILTFIFISMELSSFILVAAIIGLLSAPFIMMTRSRNKKEKHLSDMLKQMALSAQSTITQKDNNGEFVIGLDRLSGKVFFYKKTNRGSINKTVDLHNFQQCKMLKVGNGAHISDSKATTIHLSFLSKSKTELPVLFEFFNSADGFILSGEFQLAEKWMKIINSHFNSLVLSKAA
jgi:hypothetical protein